MSNLTLRQTNASGPLLPSTLGQLLTSLATRGGDRPTPIGKLRGQVLRLALELSPDDDACVAFPLDFAGQGARVRGEAHGPSADAFAWAFHALAAASRCTLETDGGAPIEPRPEAYREAAVAYLAADEAEVRADREGQTTRHDEDGAAMLEWLAREEHIALAGDAGELGATLAMNDASALYGQLLDSDAVEDVFISESELRALLARFQARWHVSR